MYFLNGNGSYDSDKKNAKPDANTKDPSYFSRCTYFGCPSSPLVSTGKQKKSMDCNDEGPDRRSNVSRVKKESLQATNAARIHRALDYPVKESNASEGLNKV